MRMRLLRGARRQQRRHDGVAEMIERHLVAEEQRLVGRHRLDHLDDQRLGVGALQLGDQPGEVEQAGLARDRQQPAFDQILLVGRQHEAGALLQQLAQDNRNRAASRPRLRGTTARSSARSASSGSTAEHTPASTAEPGMPQTTLVASSCAITLPPAATIVGGAVGAVGAHAGEDQRQIPGAPDLGGGREQRIDRRLAEIAPAAPSSSAITAVPSRRATRMCLPPGAR